MPCGTHAESHQKGQQEISREKKNIVTGIVSIENPHLLAGVGAGVIIVFGRDPQLGAIEDDSHNFAGI